MLKPEQSRKEVKRPVSTGNVQVEQQEPSVKYMPMRQQFEEAQHRSVSKTKPFKMTERKPTQTQVVQQPEDPSYSEKQPSPISPAYVQEDAAPPVQPPVAFERPTVKEESKKTAAYRDGISEQVKDIVKKFSFNRPREYTIKSRVSKPKKQQ